MSYEERRVRVKDYGTMPRNSPLLAEIPGTRDKPRKLHKLAAAAFEAMAEAVHEDIGIELRAASAWRRHRWKSWEHYEKTMVRKYGSVSAGRKWMAYNSPHETGLAVDFGVGGLEPNRKTRKKQQATPLHAWLVENAWKYGFHPYKREPWHWEHPLSKEEWETGESARDPAQARDPGDTAPFFFSDGDDDEDEDEAFVEDSLFDDDAMWFLAEDDEDDDSDEHDAAAASSVDVEIDAPERLAATAPRGDVSGEFSVGEGEESVTIRWRVRWDLSGEG